MVKQLFSTMFSIAFAEMMGCWALFVVVFVYNAVRVRRTRTASEHAPGRVRDRVADTGTLLEFLGFLVVWMRPFQVQPSPISIACSMFLAPVSLALAFWALYHLGQQWRIQAVVTRDHQLITAGPYNLVRHPIYTALLGMLVANALLVSPWPLALAGLALYIVGTEIRVRAEDKLLLQRFGAEFASYRSRIRAYIPFIA